MVEYPSLYEVMLEAILQYLMTKNLDSVRMGWSASYETDLKFTRYLMSLAESSS